MPEFILDTSAAVEGVPPVRGHAPEGILEVRFFGHVKWSYLDAFTQGYIEALFFTENAPNAPDLETFQAQCESGENEGSIPANATFADIAPEALARIIEDCAKFQKANSGLLAEALRRDYTCEQAGRDFWFTRNGHGVGYWDREELEPQGEEWEATRIPIDQWTPELTATRERLKAQALETRLTEAAKQFGEADIYTGDDGRVYLL